jgi:hypothetical protein
MNQLKATNPPRRYPYILDELQVGQKFWLAPDNGFWWTKRAVIGAGPHAVYLNAFHHEIGTYFSPGTLVWIEQGRFKHDEPD